MSNNTWDTQHVWAAQVMHVCSNTSLGDSAPCQFFLHHRSRSQEKKTKKNRQWKWSADSRIGIIGVLHSRSVHVTEMKKIYNVSGEGQYFSSLLPSLSLSLSLSLYLSLNNSKRKSHNHRYWSLSKTLTQCRETGLAEHSGRQQHCLRRHYRRTSHSSSAKHIEVGSVSHL